MEGRIRRVEEYTRNKFKGVEEFQKDSGRQNFGRQCIAVNNTETLSGDSKYFSGSTLNIDLKPRPFFSYHRENFKTTFTTSEKQHLVSSVQTQLLNGSEIIWGELVIPNKSEIQCLMKYRNDYDPCINHGKWTSVEEDSLLRAVGVHREHDWCRIAELVTVVTSVDSGARTPLQCLQHYQLNFNKGLMRSTEWSADEERVLVEAAALYGTNRTWQHISNCLEGRAASQCFVRWKRIRARGMKSGTWDADEERRLVFAIVAHEKRGGSLLGSSRRSADQSALWSIISAYVPHRDEVRCREKWTSVMDPLTVDPTPFTPSEDAVLLREAAVSGNSIAVGWARIAALLRGRTDAQCLRRWKELSGPRQAKIYIEGSKKRRSITVPRHARLKASNSSLDNSGYVPVLSST